MLTRIVLFLLLAVPAAGIAEAQGVYFGPSAGFQKSRDADNGEFLGGLAFRIRPLPTVGAEASIYYRQEEFGDGDVTVRSWPVMATAFFYPISYVYGSVGGGWFHTTFDYSSALNNTGVDDNTEEEFGWHFGGGVEVPLSERVRLAGDIRYVFLDYDFEGLPGRDIDSNFFMITASILFSPF